MRGRDIGLIVGGVAVVILLLGLFSGGMMGGGMMGPNGMGWDNWDGYRFHPLWGVAMILVWGLIIGGVVALVAWLFRQGGGEPEAGAGRGRALNILQERYARGELTREQYEQMRRDLEG